MGKGMICLTSTTDPVATALGTDLTSMTQPVLTASNATCLRQPGDVTLTLNYFSPQFIN
jgi:hypothetical protein